jgi:hypothetical protein
MPKPFKPIAIRYNSMKDTLVLSLDFDGCTDTSESRYKLIEFISFYCFTNPHYKVVALAIGSLRQFVITDYYNARMHYQSHGNRLISCSILLKEFAQELQVQLKAILLGAAPQVKTIKLLASDIFNNLEIGTTFNHMDHDIYLSMLRSNSFLPISIRTSCGREVSELSKIEFDDWYTDLMEQYEDDEKGLENFLSRWMVSLDELEAYKDWRDNWINPALIVKRLDDLTTILLEIESNGLGHKGNSVLLNDTSKVMVLHILQQYLANKIKKPFDILHFDDKREILDYIDDSYTKHPALLMEKVGYRSVEWNSSPTFDKTCVSVRPFIYGIGKLNKDYANDVKSIASSFFPVTRPKQNKLLHKLRESCTSLISREEDGKVVLTRSVNSSFKLFEPRPHRFMPRIVEISDDNNEFRK